MATSTVQPDYREMPDGFSSTLDEAKRFSTAREMLSVPEIEQSGNLPGQPDVPDAAPGNARPWKPL